MTTKLTAPPERKGPLAMLDELREDMEQLWDRPFPLFFQPFGRSAVRRLGKRMAVWTPTLDVYEKEGELIVKADLPGLRKEDVEVTVIEGDLILRGERKEEKQVKDEDYVRMECNYGSFYRRLPLGFEPDLKLVVAKFVDGVLEVKIPIPVGKRPEPSKLPVT